MLRRSLLAGAGLGLALGPRAAFSRDETIVRGSGTIVTETREVGAFRAVDLRGPCDVILRPAAHAGSLSLRGEDNVLPLFETIVRQDATQRVLEIGLRRHVRLDSRSTVTVTVDVERLDSIALGGTGRIHGAGLRADTLDVALAGIGEIGLSDLQAGELGLSIAGSGSIANDGRAPRLRVSIAGTGEVRAEALRSDDVTVAIAGIGQARVRAEKSLRVSIPGMGQVTYRGDPQVSTSISGVGQVGRG